MKESREQCDIASTEKEVELKFCQKQVKDVNKQLKLSDKIVLLQKAKMHI